MDVYVVEWASTDVDDQRFEIRAFGKTADGQSVVLRIAFHPYFFVSLKNWSLARQKLFISDCLRDYRANEQYSLPVMRKDAWGYSTQPHAFVQLAFDTLKAQKICRSRLAKSGKATYEGNVDPVVRLCHVRGISPTGWLTADATFRTPNADRKFPNADIELCGSFLGISPSTCTLRPPLILCSWDLECYSHTGSFPTPDVPENAVIQIACAFQKLGDPEPYRKVVVCVNETSPIEGADIISVATEADLYAEWVGVLATEKVDIFMGWNTWGFDWKYIAGRVAVLTDDFGNEAVDLTGLGRGPEDAGDIRTWELNSGAYGNNSYLLLKAPGILDLDLMQLVKRDKKLPSYSLNSVSKEFLGGETKLDLPAHEIFSKFEGTPDDRADIARYAVQDVLLPLKLFAKLNMYDNLAQMSVATCVPMDYLLSRGQQIKVFSLILKQARELGYVLPDDKSITIEGKFEGATVLQAKKGVYYDVISGLDFASLYPSILRSYNLCYSTLIVPGGEEPPSDQIYRVETGLGVYSFAQNHPGIVPKLLENLAVWRKDAKRKMAECKAAGDTFGAAVWDGSQAAFKVSMNSVYGFLGASHGFLPCVPIAAAVTATGRMMIEKTKNLAESLVPGSEVVYDSVMVKFKVPEGLEHDMKTHFDLAQTVAKQISDTFPGCVELEFEKCYYPYMLFSKKRYAGLMWTKPEKPDYIDVKGLQLVRRDNAPIVKKVSQAILDTIMYDRETGKALAAAKKAVLDVLQGKEPIEAFTVTKALRGTYVNPDSQPHVVVAKKIKARTGEAVRSGERVPFVFVVDDNIDSSKVSAKAEDPRYAIDNNLDLDFLYYIDNQLMSPIKALLELLVADPTAEILGDPEIAGILETLRATRKVLVRETKRVKTNVTNKQHEITKFFKVSKH